MGLDNSLGRLPGLGWNSDYCTNCSKSGNGFQNEIFIRHIADSFVSMGFQKLGYHYVNMDASWDTPHRDGNGDLVPDPALWPSGIQSTIDYVHARGLGFGLYGDKGTEDCAKNPGQKGFVTQDAQFLARHKVDWFKEDSCASGGSHAQQIADYAQMRDALNTTGRPIWFALCGWHTWYATDSGGGQALGNSWRIGPDTGTGWSAVMINALSGLAVAESGVPGPSRSGGAWSDGSLLLNPGMGHTARDEISNARSRSMFSLWCILSFNLLMTGNLTALDPFVIETYSNAEAIAVNQDPAAHVPRRVDGVSLPPSRKPPPLDPRRSPSRGLARAPPGGALQEYAPASLAECGGEPEQQVWAVDTPLPGFVHNAKLNVCLNLEGCGSKIIYDHCTTSGMGCMGTAADPFPNQRWDWNATDGTLRTRLPDSGEHRGKGNCATVSPDGQLSTSKCAAATPLPSQGFHYDSGSGQITSTADGRCLTAAAPSPPGPSPPSSSSTLAVGKTLHDGSVALLLLNNQPMRANVTCDLTCFGRLGFDAADAVSVRDLWQHTEVGTTTGAHGWTAEIDADGASVLLVLS